MSSPPIPEHQPPPRWGRVLVLGCIAWLTLAGVVLVMRFKTLAVLQGFDIELQPLHVLFLHVTSLLFRTRMYQIVQTVSVVVTVVSLHLGAVFAIQSSFQGNQQFRFGLRILVVIVAILPGFVALLGGIVAMIDLLKLVNELS